MAGRKNELGNNPKQQEELLALIADGLSLREACKRDGMPDRGTVFRLCETDEAFRNQYARACEARSDAIFDEMLDIADDGTNDWQTKQSADGESYESLNAEHVQRSRLRIDARKWVLSKMNPKKYGDKIGLEHSGGLTVTLEPDASKL